MNELVRFLKTLVIAMGLLFFSIYSYGIEIRDWHGFSGNYKDDASKVITFETSINVEDNIGKAGAGTYYIDGKSFSLTGKNQTYSGFELNNKNIIFSNLNLTNFKSVSNGAVILSNGSTITFRDNKIDFIHNEANNNGGVIYAKGGSSITFDNVSTDFSNNNTVFESGGAIFLDNSTINFNSSIVRFINNKADDSGGAIYVSNNSSITFIGRTVDFVGNESNVSGGAIYIDGGSNMVIENGSFQNNKAIGQAANGGAIYVSGLGTKVTIRATNKDVMLLGNNANDGKKNDIYMGTNTELVLDAIAAYKIQMEGGIKGDINTSITKTGSGEFLLGGIVDYSGELNLVNGITRLTTVQATIGTLNIGVDAIYSMANGEGNITNITGAIISGGLEIDIDIVNQEVDKIVGVNITLENTSVLSVVPYGIGSARIEIITGNITINGKFSNTNSDDKFSVTQIGSKSDVKVIYGSDKIEVDIKTNSNLLGVPSLSHNQTEVSKVFDNVDGDNINNSIGDLISPIIKIAVDNDFSLVRKALDEASGVFLANMLALGAINNDSSALYFRIKKPVIKIGEDVLNTAWIQGDVNGLTYSDDKVLIGDFKSFGGGVQAGVNFFVGENELLGAYFGYDSNRFEQGFDKGNMGDTRIGLYGGLFNKDINFRGNISFGAQSFSTQRKLTYTQRQLQPKADFNTYSIRLGAEAEYPVVLSNKVEIKPFLGLQSGYVFNGKIDEKEGDAANLTIDANDYLRLSLLAGSKVEHTLNEVSLYFKGYIGYLIIGNNHEYEMSFTQTPEYGKMDIWGAKESEVFGGFGIGGEYEINPKISVFLNTDFNLGADIFRYFVNTGVNYKFDVTKKEERKEPILNDILAARFESADYALQDIYKTLIKNLAEDIKRFKYTRIIISGHTDASGKEILNKGLSMLRARVVFEEFVLNGIPSEKMEYIGYGPDRPIASNGTEEGMKRNRRVVISIIQ